MVEKIAVARLMVRTTPVLMRRVAADLRCCGNTIASAHFRILTDLTVHSYRLTDLAEQQGVTLATISKTITTLVERGWVKGMAVAGDRRVVLVEITPEGKNVLRSLQGILESRMEQSLESLSEQELITLEAAFELLRRILPDNKFDRPENEKYV